MYVYFSTALTSVSWVLKLVPVSTCFCLSSLCMPWNRSIACLSCLTKCLETNFITLENGTSCGTFNFGVREMRNISMQICKLLIPIASRVKPLLSGSLARWEHLFHGKIWQYRGSGVPRIQMSSTALNGTCLQRNKISSPCFPLWTNFTVLFFCYYKFLFI